MTPENIEGSSASEILLLLNKVATQGQTISLALLNYISNLPERQAFFPTLAATVNTTSCILTSFAKFKDGHSSFEIGLDEQTMRGIFLRVQADFAKVERALESVKEKTEKGDLEDVGDVAAVQRERKETRIVPTSTALSEELRGTGEVYDLIERLEGVRIFLVCVLEGWEFLVLRGEEKEKEDNLEPEKKKTLKQLSERMPEILEEMSRRKNDLVELAKEGLLARNKGKAADDGKNNAPTQIRARQPARWERDDDVRSIASFDSIASNQFLDVKEIYEYYILQAIDGQNNTRRSWGFLGLRINEYIDDTVYLLDGKAKPQAELKAKDEEAKTEEGKQMRQASIKKTIASLPHRLQTEIYYLLQDRQRVSTNTRFIREWTLIDLQPVKAKVDTVGSPWNAWWKSRPGTRQWSLIIKGENTIETEGEKMKTPNRFEDPWRKYLSRRRPDYIDTRPIAVEPRFRPERVVVHERTPGYDDRRYRAKDHLIPEIHSPDDAEERIIKLLADVNVNSKGRE